MKWLHFILSHSIFVAVCAVALSFQTSQLSGITVDPFIYSFIFFATLCSYNFYWILSKINFAGQASMATVLLKESAGFLLLLISGVGLTVCFFQSTLNLTYVLVAIALTVIYSVPLLPVKIIQFTRRLGVLKTVMLAATWAYVTAFLPMQKAFHLLDNADLFIISRRFLFMLMLCIIFDNRDKAVDKIRGLRSLATDLRPAAMNWLIYLIFFLLFTSNFFYRNYGISLGQSIALQVSTLALLVVYFFSTKRQGYLFYYFLVDGLMLFSALATFIGSI